jgi:transposase-like protein
MAEKRTRRRFTAEFKAQAVKWLRRGRLRGHQSAKGQPWQIQLAAGQAERNRHSKMKAS